MPDFFFASVFLSLNTIPLLYPLTIALRVFRFYKQPDPAAVTVQRVALGNERLLRALPAQALGDISWLAVRLHSSLSLSLFIFLSFFLSLSFGLSRSASVSVLFLYTAFFFCSQPRRTTGAAAWLLSQRSERG
jgi:hypothetical protein